MLTVKLDWKNLTYIPVDFCILSLYSVYLKLFSFICELSFDVYMKMQMIEQLTDQLRAERPDPKKK